MDDKLQDQWVMVPRIPTQDMLEEGCDECLANGDAVHESTMRRGWDSMLAAAPQQAPAAPSPDVEQQARVLLAEEYERDERLFSGRTLRAGGVIGDSERALRAITAALRQQPVQSREVTSDALIDEYGPLTAEQLAGWLDKKYKRHGEDEDRQAAAMLRAYAQQPVQAAPGAVGKVLWSSINCADRYVHAFVHDVPLPEGTPLYAAPHATPALRADARRWREAIAAFCSDPAATEWPYWRKIGCRPVRVLVSPPPAGADHE